MKKIGLYFGSFNPVHVGHLIVAEYFTSREDLDEVWLVVSPQNPLKNPEHLAGEFHRAAMVKLAVEGNNGLLACDIEFTMTRPSYTAETLKLLSTTFPAFHFTIILGEDNMPYFHKWKNYQWILDNYAMRFFPRYHSVPDTSQIDWVKYDVRKADAPRIECSSTHIRELIRQKKSVRYMLPETVIKYISTHGLYIS